MIFVKLIQAGEVEVKVRAEGVLRPSRPRGDDHGSKSGINIDSHSHASAEFGVAQGSARRSSNSFLNAFEV